MGGAVRQRATIVVAVALTATVAVAVIPDLRFTYVGATTRVAMETAQAVIAGIVAVLVHGRFRRSGSRLDLLLVVALGTAMVRNLFTVVVRATAEERATLSELASWSSLGLSLAIATAYAAASTLPDRTFSPLQRSALRPLALIAGTSAAVWLVVGALGDRLPVTVSADLAESSRPELDSGAAALATHLVVLVLLALGGVGFLRRAVRHPGDLLLSAVGIGVSLAAVARLNYVLFPSAHTTVVHTGDVAGLSSYLVLLFGAVREISGYWRDRAQLAVLDERRRMARDLHDGLLQELSFIRSQVSAFTRHPPTPTTIDFVTTAADQAMTEARRVVRALSDDTDGALDTVVRRAVADIADRAGLPVTFELEPGVHVDATVAEQVRRVTREAVTNVVRHANATSLQVTMRSRYGRLRLVVADDGRGVDPAAGDAGFGIGSMRQRAALLNGTLAVESTPGGGTSVVLELPTAQVHSQVGADDGQQAGGIA